MKPNSSTSPTTMGLKSILFFIFIFSSATSFAQIRINEILVSNMISNLDTEYYGYGDWVELYNEGSGTINLNGYSITDDLDNPTRYTINENIYLEANDYILIWTDKEASGLHTNFSLSADGEFVGVFNPSMTLIDSLTYPEQYPDISYGRHTNGSWGFYGIPSPSAVNSGFFSTSAQFSSEVSFSISSGFYSGSQSINLEVSEANTDIYYTTDGSFPDINSSATDLYTSPIVISSNTVVRARSYNSALLPGRIHTQTYFINEDVSLPVLSLSTNPDHFFDDEIGIWVVGTNGISGNCTGPSNWNQDWERPIGVEYFSASGEALLNQNAGVKISGNCTRIFNHKSLALMSRGKYGKSGFDYKFFNDKDINSFKSLTVRHSGNDYNSSRLRDGFMQNIVKNRMDIDYQEFQPTLVFLNGDYWGHYNMREKLNEHYIAANNDGIDPDEIDYVEFNNAISTLHGSRDDFDVFMDFIENNDLSLSSNYDTVKSRMDVNEYLNYYISQIYFGNQDWPQNNLKFWKSQEKGSKWRWVLFDTDYGYGRHSNDPSYSTLAWAMYGSTEYTGHVWSTELFSTLLENDEFKSEFIQRFAVHLNTTFESDRVVGILYDIAAELRPEMQRHIDRWGRPERIDYWEWAINRTMTEYAEDRPATVRQDILDEFDLSGTYTLTLSTTNSEYGTVYVNGVDVPYNYSGTHFDNVPARLTAVPKKGYRFLGWSGASTSTSREIQLTQSSNTSVTAIFGLAIPIDDIIINEFSCKSSGSFKDDYNEESDWIELYNKGVNPIDVGGMYLSDSAGFPDKYLIDPMQPQKTTIQPGEYLIFYADNDAFQGIYHLNFKLSSDGEQIVLSQYTNDAYTIVDSITYSKFEHNYTQGRYPNGGIAWSKMPASAGGENYIPTATGLFINEYSANNLSSVENDEGTYTDWIEIYNDNDFSVNIGGFFLTDSLANPYKHRINDNDPESTTISAKGHLVFWADNIPEQGVHHLDFKLSRSGEQLGLFDFTGTQAIDTFSYAETPKNSSISRFPDASSNWLALPATPEAENSAPVVSGIYINEYSAHSLENPDKFMEFDDWIEIYNDNSFSVDIGGLYITDSLNFPIAHRISSEFPDSTTIPAKSHLLLWADNQEEQGLLHLDFKLSRSGEQIGVFNYDQTTVIDSLTYSKQPRNSSISRLPNGADNWKLIPPTPESNNVNVLVTGLYINEYSAHSLENPDKFMEFDDWIEIYNDNSFSVDIGGLYITDSLNFPEAHRISSEYPDSTTIPAKSHLLLWADNQEEQGLFHLDFKLSRGGEQIGIFNYDQTTVVDSLTYIEQPKNSSISRLPDGSDTWKLLPPSPESSNINVFVTGLFINEYSADNENIIFDPNGETEDWIEIYNFNNFPVDVGGLFLTDSIGDATKHRISSEFPDSTTIPAKGYLVFWADNEEEQGVHHLDFKLSRKAGQIALFNYDAEIAIDHLTYTEQIENTSISRYPDGFDNWITLHPSPEATNLIVTASELYINEFSADNDNIIFDSNGEADDWIEIYNNNNFSVDIGGLYITDSIDHAAKHRISSLCPDSTTIPAKGFLLLWADSQKEQGVHHLDFKLSRSGEQIALFNYDTESIIDSIIYDKQYKNASVSAFPQTTKNWVHVPSTPLMQNLVPTVNSIVINEVSADNENIIADENDEFDDWIELHNTSSDPINVAGLFLSDSLGYEYYRIPSTFSDSTLIEANGYLLLWADNQTEQGVLHQDFKLNSKGEELVLLSYDKTSVLDAIVIPDQYDNSSYGRLNSDPSYWTFIPPTPDAPNILPEYDHLYINEFMTDNSRFNFDENGEFEDWIEIYNSWSLPIDVGGLYLTDSLDHMSKYRIPTSHPDSTTIPPNGHILFWADKQEEQGIRHLDFKLRKSEEQIGLANCYQKIPEYIDSLTYKEFPSNFSFGRNKDGDGIWKVFTSPTPEWANGSTSDIPITASTRTQIVVSPNPFSETLNFSLDLEEEATVSITIVDMSATVISSIQEQYLPAGKNTIEWTAENYFGNRLMPGMYICRIRINNEILIRKVIAR